MFKFSNAAQIGELVRVVDFFNIWKQKDGAFIKFRRVWHYPNVFIFGRFDNLGVVDRRNVNLQQLWKS